MLYIVAIVVGLVVGCVVGFFAAIHLVNTTVVFPW